MDFTKIIEQWAASAPNAAIIGIVVWYTLRDHGKLLRSMDLRLAKILERQRTTPPLGVHVRPSHKRSRTHGDSDEPPMAIPRTVSEDDIEGGG